MICFFLYYEFIRTCCWCSRRSRSVSRAVIQKHCTALTNQSVAFTLQSALRSCEVSSRTPMFTVLKLHQSTFPPLDMFLSLKRHFCFLAWEYSSFLSCGHVEREEDEVCGVRGHEEEVHVGVFTSRFWACADVMLILT